MLKNEDDKIKKLEDEKDSIKTQVEELQANTPAARLKKRQTQARINQPSGQDSKTSSVKNGQPDETSK